MERSVSSAKPFQDGGGLRGLASLHLLQAVMNKAEPNKKPCDVFDMIGGTSTGGFIAIMLGRLRMTVDECIETYENLMRKVSQQAYSWDLLDLGKKACYFKKGQSYEAMVLEKAIKGLVKEKTGDAETMLYERGSPKCKV